MRSVSSYSSQFVAEPRRRFQHRCLYLLLIAPESQRDGCQASGEERYLGLSEGGSVSAHQVGYENAWQAADGSQYDQLRQGQGGEASQEAGYIVGQKWEEEDEEELKEVFKIFQESLDE